MQSETITTVAPDAVDKRIRGVIEKIITQADGKSRGFGFIRGEDGKKYFLHAKNFAPSSAFRVATAVEFIAGPDLSPTHAPCALMARPASTLIMSRVLGRALEMCMTDKDTQ